MAANQPMTAEQAATLKRLAEAAYELETFQPNLTRAEADLRIAMLTAKLRLLDGPPHTLRQAHALSPLPTALDCRSQAELLIVRDNNRQQLAYVYFENEPGRRSAAKLLTRDEARRIAVNIEKFPEFLKKP
jgi:hypothetical protein